MPSVIGAALFDARPMDYLSFSPRFLGQITAQNPDQLAGLAVRGDSMEPTLSHGDHILIDLSCGRQRSMAFMSFGWIRRSWSSAYKLIWAVGALTSSVTTRNMQRSTTLNARLSKSLAASFGWAGAFNRMLSSGGSLKSRQQGRTRFHQAVLHLPQLGHFHFCDNRRARVLARHQTR